MEGLDQWVAAVSERLGIDSGVDVDALLEVARDVAHGVSRPATPLTAYLMGVAVGAGADPAVVTAAVKDLAAGWTAE
ncbi:MAG: DUF6457 domain-containing protein [Actinomycetes bacterium]